jgi:hypothetical protein
MRPSELKEKNDRVIAFTLTIIIHAVIIAALFFVATPKFEAKKTEPVKSEVSAKIKLPEKA